MRKYAFSDRELQLAAGKVRAAMLASLPAPADCAHEFSESFLEKMNGLLQLDVRRQARKKAFQRIAAVFLALLIGAGALFAFNPAVRAAVLHWAREVYEDSIVYRFFGSDADIYESVPLYSPDWLPDGYAVADDYSDETMRSIVYQNDDGTSAVVFEYFVANEDTLLELLTGEPEQERQTIIIQGWTAELYAASEQSDTANLIWIDENQNLVFGVHGNIAPDVLVQIAESISEEK